MFRKKNLLLDLALLLVGTLLVSGPALAISVNTELLLLVDVSGSIDASEFNMQKTGYANAFQNPAVQGYIAINPGGIAVSLVYWSSRTQQAQAVGWTHLTDAASANAFATAISNTTRPYNNNTAVQAALNYGWPLFANNGFEGNNLFIDISGDGVDNNSLPTSFRLGGGRDAALANGVTTINGIVIGGSTAVANYYNDYVIGGGGVLFTAATFNDFGTAILQKIYYEVGGPGPCTENCEPPPCGTECDPPPCLDNCDPPPCVGECGGGSSGGSSSGGSSSGGSSSGGGGGNGSAVPEPATLVLMMSGLGGLALIGRRKPWVQS
jgi:hypothetical protein